MSQPAVDRLRDQVPGRELDRTRPPLTERIRERPLFSLGVASLIGFVVGGGAASRTGAATLLLIARIWVRRAATDALANVMASERLPKPKGAR